MRDVLILMHKNIYTHTQCWRKILNITLYSTIPWAAASSCLQFKSQPGMQLLGCKFTQHYLSVSNSRCRPAANGTAELAHSHSPDPAVLLCSHPALSTHHPPCSSLQCSFNTPKEKPTSPLRLQYPHCKEILPPNQNNFTFCSFQCSTDMTVKNSMHFLGFYVSFYWRAQWKGDFCIIILKKPKPKTQNNSPRGIKKERHTSYTATSWRATGGESFLPEK